MAQHAWIQVLKGDVWLDLDPTLPDAKMGDVLVAASGTAPDVPQEQQQGVIVRVVAESLTDGKFSKTVSLQRELQASVAANQYLLSCFRAGQRKEGWAAHWGRDIF